MTTQECPVLCHLHPLYGAVCYGQVTYVPLFVTMLFRGMPGLWKGRHRLMLCWLVCMQALFPGHKTLETLARGTPAQVMAWRFRRLRKANYWHVHLLVE